MNKEKLINWCWENLKFNNNPESWEDTYIVDILNGYNGACYDYDGCIWKYSAIRSMFNSEVE